MFGFGFVRKSDYNAVVRDRDSAEKWARKWSQDVIGGLRKLNAARSEVASLKAQVDSLHAERAAFAEQWESLRDENAKLKTEVSTSRHVQHCYEQCEADRQALAKERDAAAAESKRLQDAVWELEETISDAESERNQFLTERDTAVAIVKLNVRALAGIHKTARGELDKYFPEPKESDPPRDCSRVEPGITATLDAEVERPTRTFPATPKPKSND